MNTRTSPDGLTLTIPQQLLDQLATALAETLAPRLAAQLRQQAAHEATQPPLRRLVTLDQLVELLPDGRSPASWKRWLYQRTRNNKVPGCHKIGGRLYFDPEQTIPWLTGPTTGSSRPTELA